MTTRAWDGTVYDRVSNPQVEMAGPVLARLDLEGNETVLDAGCGSGRVTELLLEKLPDGRVIGVDSAPSMIERARDRLRGRPVDLRVDDVASLQLEEPVDAVFSNAVFHWIPDHDALFACIFGALRPGGALVAQCGGAGNIERFHALTREVAERDPYAPHLAGWTGPWNFQEPEATGARLERAGFEAVEVWLEPFPVVPEDPEAYLGAVCLGPHLGLLPGELRGQFVHDVVESCGHPLELDYVRLNIDARRPA